MMFLEVQQWRHNAGIRKCRKIQQIRRCHQRNVSLDLFRNLFRIARGGRLKWPTIGTEGPRAGAWKGQRVPR